MEGENDYIDLMKAHGRLERLTVAYRTTELLNKYLRTRTHFQFPVLTNNTLEDIVAYYLSMVNVDSPDDAPTSTEQERLGEYIEEYFSPRGGAWMALTLVLLSSRSRGIRLSPTSQYVLYLLKLVSERDGPAALRDYFNAAVRAMGWGLFNREHDPEDDVFELFADLDLTDCLIYYDPKYIVKSIGTVTDKAASDFEYFKWITMARENSDARYLCIVMTLAKLTQHSPSKAVFERRFRSYVRHILGDADPNAILVFLFEAAVQLLYRTQDSGIFYAYLEYMVKALTYTESVYGASLLSALGEVDEEQEEVLDMLAGDY